MSGTGVTAIQTALATYGISAENPCDLTVLGDQITEKTEALIKQTQETLNEVAADVAGPLFWPTVAQLLVEVLEVGEGVAAAFVDKMVGEVIARSVGTVYSTLALMVTSVNGFQLVINYLAAITIRNVAQKRIEMGRVLEIDLRIMISFIRQLQRVLDTERAKGAKFTSLVLA